MRLAPISLALFLTLPACGAKFSSSAPRDADPDGRLGDGASADEGIEDDGVDDTAFDDTTLPDTGRVDTGIFDTGKVDTGSFDTGSPDTFGPPLDGGSSGRTGATCATAADCDTTGDGISYCTNNLFVIGPLNPTAVCMQASSEDVCAPSTAGTPRFCDGGAGLCTKSGDQPSLCEPMCRFDSTGNYLANGACAGKNACNPEIFALDATTSKAVGFGTCQGGCELDADCPAASKCDPLHRLCVKTCTGDTQCKSGWTGAPATWRCDVARGACTFFYPKNPGDVCATSDECLCVKAATATTGFCTSVCKTGGAPCASGFTCDARVPEKAADGSTLFSLTTQPLGMGGFCLKNCAVDGDCATGLVCVRSAGLTQKTCRPPTP